MYLKILTVSEVTAYIKRLISSDVILGRLSVKGEISNFQIASGTAFFTLKDSFSSINCIMFNEALKCLAFTPQDGMQVTVSARAYFYEKEGKLYLNVSDVKLDGSGELYVAFQKLKEKLYKKGMFDEKNKKPLPFFSNKICVITSLAGSVLYDIITISKRRNPLIDLLVFPVRVQGEMAAEEIAEAIDIVNQRKDVDVIILARGGGSIEELWAFNEEVVAEAIYNSRIPVVSAIGHETDYTISDFVADKRAPTPSAAAEIVVPSLLDISARLDGLKRRLMLATGTILDAKTKELNSVVHNRIFSHPLEVLSGRRIQLMYSTRRLFDLAEKQIKVKDAEFRQLAAKLEALNPKAILNRGYAMVHTVDGRKVMSAGGIEVDNEVYLTFYDGEASCVVKEVFLNERERA
ncbi:exodeoxyribonuclease VII large subunit [Caldanaerobius polysaccharolyticus]|uniref:exodeoxyribonuclease VII large subunit n=1 Tax=Caldanaerobius polysaccharolyticus TaxID=44256 RepID=UPI00047DF2B3|nr:exodeoxyribonuclease VII large subunit [Caldanaerobius polysaccharolyticus]